MPYYHAKRLDSALCIVCFLLPSCFTCNGMLNCSCYCCCKCCCYPYCIMSLFALYLDFLSCCSRSFISLSHSSHVSLNARVILSSSHSLHPHLSISLRSPLSFWDGSHPKLFPEPLVLGRFICVLRPRTEDNSKSIISSDHVSSYQSVNHQSLSKSKCNFTRSTS